MLASWSVLLIAFVAAVQSNTVCDPEAIYEDCLYVFDEEDIKDLEGAFPKQEFLDKHCSPILGSMRCMMDSYERCPNIPNPKPELNQPFFDLVSSICDENSELRKGYLENVNCYDENQFQVIFCGVSMVALVEDFEEANENKTEYQNSLVGPCIGVPLLVNCIVDEISDACGSEETSPLAEILHRFTSLMVEATCPADLLPTWEQEFNAYLVEENNEVKRKKRHIFSRKSIFSRK